MRATRSPFFLITLLSCCCNAVPHLGTLLPSSAFPKAAASCSACSSGSAIKELNNKLQTFDLVLLLSARSSALLELRPGTAFLVLICRELQPMQQILQALVLHTDSIVGCLIVAPAFVYVVQEVCQDL